MYYINRLIDEIDEDMQRTDTRLTSLTKRVNKAIRNSSGTLIIIIILLLIMIIMFLSLSRSLSTYLYCYISNNYCNYTCNVFCTILNYSICHFLILCM